MNEKCEHCGSELIFSLTPETIHYGRLDCPTCRKWKKWVPHLNKIGLRTETSKYSLKDIMNFHKKECEPFCFTCLRKGNELGEHETLTIDHIEELDKEGEDALENLQILCSACHKLKNWARLYMNWHNKKGEKIAS